MTRFRTVDLLVTVVIGAAFGVAFLGYGQLYALIGPLTTAFKPSEGLLAGIWFLPAVLAALIVRKPGAALLAEMIAAVLSMLALAGFVVLARPSPSVLRAAAMGAVALIALASGRPRAALPALGAAVVVLVVVDPVNEAASC